MNSVREQCICTCKQCCAVGPYAMCYSTAKSCCYWKSKTLCCVTDQGNKFYHHLSINRRLTSVDLTKSLGVYGVEISVQLKAQSYGILHCTLNNKKSKLENLIFHNYNGSTGFLLRLIDSSSDRRAVQIKISDFRPRMDFRALQPTHLRMIHKPGAINKQHKAENGHGSKILKVRR